MAPRLPERYQTQVRLGRDNDVEEWLATDRTLDRPVLIRVLSSEASVTRRTTFLERNRLAASVPHQHLKLTQFRHLQAAVTICRPLHPIACRAQTNGNVISDRFIIFD